MYISLQVMVNLANSIHTVLFSLPGTSPWVNFSQQTKMKGKKPEQLRRSLLHIAESDYMKYTVMSRKAVTKIELQYM